MVLVRMVMRQFPFKIDTSKARGAPSLHTTFTGLHGIITWFNMSLNPWFCVLERHKWKEKGRVDNIMFTLALSFWDCASAQPCCDTHHIDNLVLFIITLYSQRPHLVCYYQRSLLFPSMYAWNPGETNTSIADNSTILGDPIAYTILRVNSWNPMNSHQWFLRKQLSLGVYESNNFFVSITNTRNIKM